MKLKLLYIIYLIVGGALYASPTIKQYSTLEGAFQKVFPNTDFKKIDITLSKKEKNQIESALQMALPTQNVELYRFETMNKPVGFGMVTNHIGKHYPITFFVATNTNIEIKDVVVLIYREDYGSDVRKRRFLKQFKGKTIDDPIQVNYDITSISGATLSSYAIANGVREVLTIIEQKI
ncbi:MAG: FMN-binding protein [Candidatus Margulisiibacteriota bacterium]